MKESADRAKSLTAATDAFARKSDEIKAAHQLFSGAPAFGTSSLAASVNTELVQGELLPTTRRNPAQSEIKPIAREQSNVIPVNPAVETNKLLRELLELEKSKAAENTAIRAELVTMRHRVVTDLAAAVAELKVIAQSNQTLVAALTAVYTDVNTLTRTVTEFLAPELPDFDANEHPEDTEED